MSASVQYRARDGGTFSHRSMEAAFAGHRQAGLIREWRRVREDESGTREVPLYVVTLAGGREVDLAGPWEAQAFLAGIAACRQAVHGGGPPR